MAGRNDPCPCGSGKKYKKCCMAQEPDRAVPTQALNQRLDYAVELDQAGKTPEAIAELERILNEYPQQPAALHNLGLIAHRLGDKQSAIGLLESAVAAQPDHFLYHSNLCAVYVDLGRYAEAIASAERSIKLNPGYAQTWNNRGVALLKLKRLDEAIQSFRQALELRENFVEAIAGIGEVYQSLGQYQDAVQFYHRAIELRNDNWPVYIKMADLMRQMGHFGEAERCCALVLKYAPDAWSAYFGLIDITLDIKQYERAETIARELVKLNPGMARAHFALGVALARQGKLGEAEAHYRQTVEMTPGMAEVHNNLAMVLKDTGRVDEAIQYYREACRLAHDPLWHSNLLMTMLYSSNVSPDELYQEHLRFAERFEQPYLPLRRPHDNVPDPDRKLRVGYVSADFFAHAVYYFFEPILSHHDRGQFELYGYYNNSIYDAATQNVEQSLDAFVRCDLMTDQQLAERIRSDKIDILVDLSGHTKGNRLPMFGLKPAPVQVTWLGYAGTTGLEAMDYRLTDAGMDPVGLTDPYHTEQLVRLPASSIFTWNDAGVPDVAPSPVMSGNPFTFGCLSNLAKLNDDVVRTWAEILVRAPESRLMLGGIDTDKTREMLVKRFTEAGVPVQRLILKDRCDLQSYYALHHQIDVALDPFPYNGGTTSCHAIWMGVPVLTLAGETTAARVGATLLQRFRLNDFIAESREDYIARAVAWAKSPDRLASIRETMRDRIRSDQTADPVSFTRVVEAAYREMWRNWCANKASVPGA
ncbi:MAG: tetratricopeptide repeat protein [Pseudomonadota bacterium]